MYINEVIRRANTLEPNEYTLEEKYAWCDELNAMLSQEYLEKYQKAVLEPDESGEYLLPEGITFEMIDKIIAQGREIEKYDFRSFGIKPLYGLRERMYIPEHCQRHGDITVIYIAQSQPIRTVKEESLTIKQTSDECFINLSNCRFQTGDSITITSADGNITKAGIKSVEVENDGNCKVYFDKNILNAAGEKDGYTVERIVTDETLCPPPYDVMYVEFLIAQIAKGQRNFNVHNQHMNVFNQKLRAYHNWLMKRRTQNKDNKMRNWW